MSMADTLADNLSKRTGTKFTVLRARVNGKMRYGLLAERSGFSHTFQAHRGVSHSELTQWLASISDMINMGFI